MTPPQIPPLEQGLTNGNCEKEQQRETSEFQKYPKNGERGEEFPLSLHFWSNPHVPLELRIISNPVDACWKCSGEACPRQVLNVYDLDGFNISYNGLQFATSDEAHPHIK